MPRTTDSPEAVQAVHGKDGAAIQKALDQLPDGGVVVLPAGQYAIETPLRIPSRTRIVGAGSHATLLQLVRGANCHVMTNSNHREGNENIAVTGIGIDGQMESQARPEGSTATSFASGGYFKGVRGLVLRDIRAWEIRQTALHFNNCSEVQVHELTATRVGWSGVSTSGADRIDVRSTRVVESGLDEMHSGIHLDGGTGGYLQVRVEFCTGNAIMLDSAYSELRHVVVDGVGRHAKRGLSLSGSHKFPLSDISISGEYSDNTDCGVMVSNASNVTIANAVIHRNGVYGVLLQGRSGGTRTLVTGCDILGSPKPIAELHSSGDNCFFANHISTEGHATPAAAEATKFVIATGVAQTKHVLRQAWRKTQRVPEKVATKPAPAAKTADPPAASAAKGEIATAGLEVHEVTDSFAAQCSVCGEHGTFERKAKSIRETYRCPNCRAQLRYQGQADALVAFYGTADTASIAELVQEAGFRQLSIYEPGVIGPFRRHLKTLPNYTMSDYWPDVPLGAERDGVTCQDLAALTYADASFDLLITSDIFEHVRRPREGFAEVHRVLRPRGRHVFSIPVQHPLRAQTVYRVDTSDIEDVHILEPRYHLGPRDSHHLVYTDFGADIVEDLAAVGFTTEVLRFKRGSEEASRLITFVCTKNG